MSDLPQNEIDLEDVLKGLSIPSPPQMLVDIQKEISATNPSLDRITEVIVTDPGLSGGILRTIRSPFYAMDDENISIRKAVLLLGTKTVFSIINMLCLRSQADNEKLTEGQLMFLNRFWDSSTDIATAASLIASRVQNIPEDKAYLLGLFSNVGIALMAIRFDNYSKVIANAYAGGHERIVDTENTHFNTNHAVLGYYMAKSWKIPQEVCEVIRVHHNAAELFSDHDEASSSLKDMLATLKLAEHFSCLHEVLAGQDFDHEWEQISDDVLYYLDISEDDYIDLESAIKERGIGISNFQ